MEEKLKEDRAGTPISKVGTPTSKAFVEPGKSGSINRFAVLATVEDKIEKESTSCEAIEDTVEEKVQVE